MFGCTDHFVIRVENTSSVFTNVFVCWVIQCLSCFGCDSSFCHRVGVMSVFSLCVCVCLVAVLLLLHEKIN